MTSQKTFQIQVSRDSMNQLWQNSFSSSTVEHDDSGDDTEANLSDDSDESSNFNDDSSTNEEEDSFGHKTIHLPTLKEKEKEIELVPQARDMAGG